MKLDELLGACAAGGAHCLRSVTELAAAAGPHASVAPAKFAARGRKKEGVYAYETRYDETGQAADVVLLDSKASQLNRVEHALAEAIRDGHLVLSRLPRVVVEYMRNGQPVQQADIEYSHRIFDGHVRAGELNGEAVATHPEYRRIRDAHPGDARALFDASPVSLVLGSWDSTRASRQGRWRSILVGEIIGFCRKFEEPERKGNARIDPLGARIELRGPQFQALIERQRGELSEEKIEELTKLAAKAKDGKRVSTAKVGLGSIPPNLEALAGVACRRIVRSHVLSFAALRQIRFGGDAEGDVACRALLAALALNGLARADAELSIRANCDLIETAPTRVEIWGRGGAVTTIDTLSIEQADELLGAALEYAERVAGVSWNGVTLTITGDPAIVEAAGDDADVE